MLLYRAVEWRSSQARWTRHALYSTRRNTARCNTCSLNFVIADSITTPITRGISGHQALESEILIVVDSCYTCSYYLLQGIPESPFGSCTTHWGICVTASSSTFYSHNQLSLTEKEKRTYVRSTLVFNDCRRKAIDRSFSFTRTWLSSFPLPSFSAPMLAAALLFELLAGVLRIGRSNEDTRSCWVGLCHE